jgi:hypothetical protein
MASLVEQGEAGATTAESKADTQLRCSCSTTYVKVCALPDVWRCRHPPCGHVHVAGIQWVAMDENLATDQSAVRAEAALMNEPKFQENHRANILSRNFITVGVGIATGPLYITQESVQAR